MPFPELKPRMGPPLSLGEIIKRNAPDIMIERLPFSVVPERLLWAIATVESSAGKLNVPKHEMAYCPGGYYYKRSGEVRELWRRWGDWAACSYSSFQILYVVAIELDFEGSPIDLWYDEEACPVVVKFLNQRIIKRSPGDLGDIADAYNSGTFRDEHIPYEYVKKFLRAYEEVKIE